jgi:trigger factor
MSHEHTVDFKTAFTVERLPNSQVKITGEIPFAELLAERTAALTALGKNVELDGFRKGHIPTPILEKHLGEMTILGEMAERAVAHSYPHIIQEHHIDAIGQPAIEITKIAPDNPLGLVITVAIVPEFELPDYGKIAKEVNTERPSDEVTDEELEQQIKEIQRQKAAYEKLQEKAAANATKEAGDLPTPETVDPIEEKEGEEKEESFPELTDTYVQGLGKPGQFENVEDFKTKLREHISTEKKQQNATKHRANITDKIVEATAMDLPQIMIDSELNQMWAQMQEDIERAELKMEDYLSHIKKTKEELFKEWTPAAEKRAKLQLVLNEIAKKEEMMPDKDAVETQTKELIERFKDADEHRVRLYVASVLLNEEVMKSLEAK